MQKLIPLSVNRTLGLVSVAPPAFSPNGDGRKDRLTLTFALTAPADVRIRVEREGRWVASPLLASYRAGDAALRVGRCARGRGCCATASTRLSWRPAARPERSRSAFPSSRTRRHRASASSRTRVSRSSVSEPSVLTLVVDGQALRREVKRAGVVRIPWAGPATRVRVVAWDAAGNSSGPAVRIRRD